MKGVFIQTTDTKKPLSEWLHCLYGAGIKSRTRDLLALSRVSQLRFTIDEGDFMQTTDTKKPLSEWLRCLYGAGTKSRTRDLLITSQLLYQLSYAGVKHYKKL